MRIGHGYDVHKLVDGRKCIIGGVDIPCNLGLLGHSDADVLLHAISDAILGAAAMGDIGHLFPDTDDKWKGADSLKLLEEVVRQVSLKGYKIINIVSSDIHVKSVTCLKMHRFQRFLFLFLIVSFFYISLRCKFSFNCSNFAVGFSP